MDIQFDFKVRTNLMEQLLKQAGSVNFLDAHQAAQDLL